MSDSRSWVAEQEDAREWEKARQEGCVVTAYPTQQNKGTIQSSVEAKALCSVLRKAESQGERSLVEKMIEICDPQSGLRFEELWDWWKKHKQEDVDKKYRVMIDTTIHQIGQDIKYPPMMDLVAKC